MDFKQLMRTDTIATAKALLGMVLTLDKQPLGVIVETEAYLFPNDTASHSFAGRYTNRNASMYLEAGHWYIYQIYGHQMLNFITGTAKIGEGVLIRALEIPSGKILANGPGKLTHLYGIDKRFDGQDLSQLSIEPCKTPRIIVKRPRIGIRCTEPWQSAALNFYVSGHPAVSKIKKRDVLKKVWKN